MSAYSYAFVIVATLLASACSTAQIPTQPLDLSIGFTDPVRSNYGSR